ncbi:MAG: Flp family type IVb pilin [Mariprofundus sp.]
MKNIMLYSYCWISSCLASGLDRDKERGATMVEYAIMVALIAVAGYVAVQTLGNTTSNLITNTTAAIK